MALDKTQAARRFAEHWKDKGYEKGETEKFWIALLRDICGVDRPEDVLDFQKRVDLDNKSFLDAYITGTNVLIEQKSVNVSLDKAARQSDGTSLTPFQQAKRYSDWLPYDDRARWIVVCNFREFRVHDMTRPKAAPEIIRLEDLPREWRKLQFLTDLDAKPPKEIREEALSVRAGELAGKLYDALKARYKNPDNPASLRSLNILCVRLVFLLYAEDAELDGKFAKNAFHDYLKANEQNARRALLDLFSVLAQKPEERDPYLDDALSAFPYVNGGLFEEEGIEVPRLDGEPLKILLSEMSEGFDWSDISPTIFGAIFESTL